MARLDVYRIGRSAGSALVVDVQANLLASLGTHAVVPLVPEAGFIAVLRDLNPVFEVRGERLVMLTQAVATVPTSSLRRPIASLDDHHDAILRALDILLLGF